MWKAKQKTRVQLLIEQRELRARLNKEQDLKNNTTIFSKYHKPATNQRALELGFSLRLTKMGHRF